MKKILSTVLIALCLPLLAYAYSTENSSVSETGGVSARAGETVIRTGDSSAEVRTVIRGTSNGGSVDVRVSTEQNGVRQTETRHYDIPVSGSIFVEVATSSSSRLATGTSRTRAATMVSVNASIGQTRIVTLPLSTSTALSVPIQRSPAFSWLFGIPGMISDLFKNVLISLR
ncbi:MAG: hypothetical protein Q7S01_04180 [bacterium]|nr:hypothetical protein [bacterium]